MKLIKCLAVDDEPLALELIADYCEKIDYLELVGKFTSPFEALNLLKREEIDLVFLDIQMPDLSGFAFVKSMKKAPAVIFTTAYKEYACDSYELNAIDYLLKPFSFDRFFQAIEKVNDAINSDYPIENNIISKIPADFIFINLNSKTVKLLLEDILFFKSEGDYVQIQTYSNKFLIREKLKTITEKLPLNNFVRVHKSYIIALNKIDEIYGNVIKCKHYEIPVGQLYRNSLLKAIDSIRIG